MCRQCIVESQIVQATRRNGVTGLLMSAYALDVRFNPTKRTSHCRRCGFLLFPLSFGAAADIFMDGVSHHETGQFGQSNPTDEIASIVPATIYGMQNIITRQLPENEGF